MDSWDNGNGLGHESQIGGSGIIIPSARAGSYESAMDVAKIKIAINILFIFQTLLT
jgi:hypothetical protein